MELFQAALLLSSQKTYMTVLRPNTRFMNSLRGGVYLPFKRRILPETELHRVFFMALLTKTYHYEGVYDFEPQNSVKYPFRTEGCLAELY